MYQTHTIHTLGVKLKIRASDTQDYLFQPEPWEKRFLVGVLSDLVLTDVGRTFSKYQKIPEYMIKGRAFILSPENPDIIETKTAAFKTKTEYLNELGLYFDVEMNAIRKQEALEATEVKQFFFQDCYFAANHIPQIYYPSEFGVIKAVDGWFDFENNVFTGTMSFFND